MLLQTMRFKWIAKHSVLYLPGVGPLMWLGHHVLIYRRPLSPAPPNGTAGSHSHGSHGSSHSSSNARHKTSVAQLFVQSNAALQSGIAMFLFPQGTRRMTRGRRAASDATTTKNTTSNDNNNNSEDTMDAQQHLPFKDGAFIMAEDNGSTLIPISIIIPRDNSCWNSWYPLLHCIWFLLGSTSSSTTTIPTIRLVIHEPVLAVDVKTQQKRSREELKELCYNAIYSVPELFDNISGGGDNGAGETAKKNK